MENYVAAQLQQLGAAAALGGAAGLVYDVLRSARLLDRRDRRLTHLLDGVFAALLGALDAQLDLNIAAIGGKDSMSGTFEKMDVPPTLCSFAIAPGKASEVISPEFKEAGHAIRLVSCDPHDTAALTANYDAVLSAIRAGKVVSAWALGLGGVAEGLFKMGIGNQIGTRIDDDYDGNLFAQQIGAMLLECTEDIDLGVKVGDTVPELSLIHI